MLLRKKPYTKTYVLYEDIIKGGMLKFFMASTPDKSYGADKDDRPKSVY